MLRSDQSSVASVRCVGALIASLCLLVPGTLSAQDRAVPSAGGGSGVAPQVPSLAPSAPSKTNVEQQKTDSMPVAPGAAPDAEKHAYPKALKDMVDAHMARRAYDPAIAALSEAMTKEPSNARLLMARSEAYCRQGKQQPCLEDANGAVTADTDFADAYVHRATVRMLNLGRPAEALPDLETVIKLTPNAPIGYFLRGYAQRQLRNYSQSIADFDQAIAREPKHALAHQNKGLTYYLWEKYDDAMVSASAAIGIDENRSQAWAIRGLSRLARNDETNARTDLQKAISINGRDYYAQLGMQALNVGRALDVYATTK